MPRLLLAGGEDPEERFEIKGEYTRHKHMTLDQYKLALAPELFNQMQIVSAIRHPVKRSMSFYFSPHRWVMKKRSIRIKNRIIGILGGTQRESASDFTTAKPVFSIDMFKEALTDMPSMSSYLSVNGLLKAPNFLIRHEDFEKDCTYFAHKSGISTPDFSKKLNRSTISSERLEDISSDRRVIEFVRNRYAEDFINFGYE